MGGTLGGGALLIGPAPGGCMGGALIGAPMLDCSCKPVGVSYLGVIGAGGF